MKFLFNFYNKLVNREQGKEPAKEPIKDANTSRTSEHKRICKHRPNDECTHYQKT